MFSKQFLVLISLFSIVFAADLPSNFQTCKRSDSDFNGCLKKAIENVLPILEKGIPELNFPPGQPIFVPSMTIGEGKGTVHVVQNYNNLSIYNFFSPKIENVEAKITDGGFELTIDLFFPHILVEGGYDFNGKILVPIGSNCWKGSMQNDMKSQITIHGEEFMKRGQPYYDIKDLKMILNPKKITLVLMDLFNGDKRLGDEMNKIINENWQAIWEDVKEAYEITMGLIFKNLATIIFKKIPNNQIFKE